MRRIGDILAAAALGAAMANSGLAAAASQSGPGGLSPQSNGPIDITADNGTYDNATCESTWTGSAEVLQGTSRLRAHEIRAFMKHKPTSAAARPASTSPADQSACGAAERLEADGDVFYVTPDETARGDHAVYSADANLIVMTGDVILVQGKNVVHGTRLTIHTQTRAAQMESDQQGRGSPGRVRAVFYQNQPGAPGTVPH
jgi:lipopolysaccharide export system protein LptA